MIFDGDDYVGTIDWDAAGAGSYGVDLGSLRLDAALFHGLAAIDEVLAGWQEAAGRDADNVAYWDIVAALNVEADTSGSIAAMYETGRTDLDGPTMNRRRDEFLEDALRRLR
jgi:aminoglycoside phosphotransferase (APT) family kinase protein